MTPADVATSDIGERFGPAALSFVFILAARGGSLALSDDRLAASLGVTVKTFRRVRSALASADVISYKPGRKGRPTTYTVGSAVWSGPEPTPPPAPSALKKRGKPAEPKKREPFPLFDVIVEFSGANPGQSGRVAKLARLIEKAGITAERFREDFPLVLATYAPWRTSMDLGTITECWGWILNPPHKNGKPAQPDSIDMAKEAFEAAGGNPWKVKN